MSNALKQYLEEHDIRQAAFGLRIGCSAGRVSQIVNSGECTPENAIAIHRATNGAVPVSSWGLDCSFQFNSAGVPVAYVVNVLPIAS